MTVYLIHINPPFKHARHYIGWTSGVDTVRERYKSHLFGTGSALLRAASSAGCALVIAHVWDSGDRRFERYLKDRKDAPRWCPRCKGKRGPIPSRMPDGYITSTERANGHG